MKLFVTGGAGFIGSNFIRYMLNEHSDIEIVNFDALTYAGNLENLKEIDGDGRYRFVKGDICEYEHVKSAMQGCDIVVHFAAESHVDRSITGPAVFVRTNVIGTQVLLNVAKELKVQRFHHVSTDEVYGMIELDSKEEWVEDSPYNPRSPYAASKAASDHLVRAYHITYGLPITITNCSNNFGPYHFPEKLIPLAVTNILEGKKIPIYKPGNQVRDWLYVTDHCRAIDLVLEKGKIGETYLVGSQHREYTNLEVARMILKILGESEDKIEMVGDRPGHDVKYAINASKIRRELGWEPEHDFEDWLEKTVQWYRDNEDWWKRVKSGEYQDYYKKQYSNR
ncbi:MAG: dTDP-glucose 4,6-dehydratase [bacterium]|nr:dTDP-glucose 4,6-dehydratase [bacterium]